MRETIETNRDWLAHWTSVGQRTPRDELYRQVERTVGGKPVSPDEIELLTEAITQRLNLGRDDVLLDLCCGNGLITARLSPLCRAVVGADYTIELIQTARERQPMPNTVYLHRAADDLHPTDFPVGPPTKVCMNGGLQYLTEALTKRVLRSLRALARQDLVIFFTDVPDAAKLDAFYNTPERRAEFEWRRAAATEPMGTWWDRDHLRGLMQSANYAASIIEPDPGRSTAHYRFDVLAHFVR